MIFVSPLQASTSGRLFTLMAVNWSLFASALYLYASCFLVVYRCLSFLVFVGSCCESHNFEYSLLLSYRIHSFFLLSLHKNTRTTILSSFLHLTSQTMVKHYIKTHICKFISLYFKNLASAPPSVPKERTPSGWLTQSKESIKAGTPVCHFGFF